MAWGWVVAGVLAVAAAAPVRAGTFLTDLWDNGGVAPGLVFPNWLKVWTGSYDVLLCNGCTASPENLTGLTVVNFGTATAADVVGVYWRARCGATATGTLTMTYAGVYAEDSGSYPAWTWSGSTIDFSACADLCGTPACGAYFSIDVYVDIAPCPSDLATVTMGLPFRAGGAVGGSLSDNWGAAVPWGDTSSATKRIVYVYKDTDLDIAAPGDTVTYTITYGRPGTAVLSNIVVTDSLPPFVHYVSGGAAPAPDVGWDPDPGPPLRLKWTLPGGATTGGPTGQVTFKVTVDWGNMDSFEPGSGDVAAPEAARLDNRATADYAGISGGGCPASATSPPDTTVVRRFLFWQLGDNDILFSPVPGQPADEITYSIFVKNVSAVKTWWDVALWETVPAELDPWGTGFGFDDPCLGWTMTPGGCAAASPGRVVAGGTTLLTWRLDMPPGVTLTLRWKAGVRPTVTAGATAVSVLSVRERGRTGIVDGTGDSGAPRTFAHVAPIVLPTTYVSYVAHAASCIHNSKGECMGYFLPMFPLNKRTQFELRGLEYQAGGWASTGGLSASIGCLIGDCVGGFPGSPGPCPSGPLSAGTSFSSGPLGAGCRVERIPAIYSPEQWCWCGAAACPTWPQHNIYKLTSNSPVLWQYLPWLTAVGDLRDENNTTAPSTSLTYCGLMHYMWKRNDRGTGSAAYGDALVMMSTGLDAYGNLSPSLSTSVHLFRFNYGTNAWDYRLTYELGPEGVAYQQGTAAADAGAWRTVSSAARLIVTHGSEINYMLDPNVGGVLSTFMPTRETGNNVSAGPATFYGVIPSNPPGAELIIGNLGAATATYQIDRYFPDNMVPPPLMPAWLNGTSGRWVTVSASFTLPPGLATPANPHYLLNAPFLVPGSVAAYRLRLAAGGPIQALVGWAYGDRSGGAVHHAADGNQTGAEFWVNQEVGGNGAKCPTSTLLTCDLFCPRTGMAVQAVSEDGYSARYTTTGPDQCVAFMDFTDIAAGTKRNTRFYLAPGSASGRLIMLHIQAMNEQKGYTAPFIFAGTHYTIIAPPVVFVGQSFWITVVVLDAGASKTDYCGTTSFTSTDPGAKLEGTPMDAYNFTWSSATACSAPPDENGVRVFVNVTMSVLGLQTIVASDTVDGSIAGVAAVMVVGADVKLTKLPPLTLAASGDTVQFRVCWSNYSSASAFTFVITDAVPVGTSYVPDAATTMDCGNTDGLSLAVAYSTAMTATAPPPASFVTIGGATQPPAATRWLRWTIPLAGVETTGCVCYRVTVN